ARSLPDGARAAAGHAGGGGELVAALGDSITAGSPLWDPNPTVRDRLGDSINPQSQFEYWASRRFAGRLRFRNCGVYGERTDEIARRLGRCVSGARALIVQGGINDIAQHVAVSRVAINLAAMVRRGRARGLTTEVAEVLPWNNGYPAAAPQIVALNARIAQI